MHKEENTTQNEQPLEKVQEGVDAQPDSQVAPPVRKKPGPKGPRKKKEKEAEAPPEMEVRKDPAEIRDVYAALDRSHKAELAVYEHRQQLAQRFQEETGRAIRVGPAPVHPLQQRESERMPQTKCLAAARGGIALAGSLWGVESRPDEKALNEMAEAISDLSRHYPDFESKTVDWIGVALAFVAVTAPMRVEKKLREKNEWTPEQQEKFRRLGYLEAMP